MTHKIDQSIRCNHSFQKSCQPTMPIVVLSGDATNASFVLDWLTSWKGGGSRWSHVFSWINNKFCHSLFLCLTEHIRCLFCISCCMSCCEWVPEIVLVVTWSDWPSHCSAQPRRFKVFIANVVCVLDEKSFWKIVHSWKAEAWLWNLKSFETELEFVVVNTATHWVVLPIEASDKNLVVLCVLLLLLSFCFLGLLATHWSFGCSCRSCSFVWFASVVGTWHSRFFLFTLVLVDLCCFSNDFAFKSQFGLIFVADQTTLFSTSTSTLKRMTAMFLVNFEIDFKEEKGLVFN